MNYSKISPEFTNKFFELVKASKRVVITGHRLPDDDAIASVLALYSIITEREPSKEVKMILSAEPEDRYRSFKGFNKIDFVKDIANEVLPDDLLIVLDGSQLYRFSQEPEKLAKVKTRICIDHHSSPADDFALSLIAPQYPAAAEVIYRAFCGNKTVSKDLAKIFLLGILGDTGTFAYLRPDQTATLDMAKELIPIVGVAIQEFKAAYNTISQRELSIQKELLRNATCASIAGWPSFQYSFITKSFMKQGNYTENEISGGLYTSHFLLRVTDHRWGFVVTPRSNDDIRLSCRSLPKSVNVRDMMERMQLGGGHDRAAGGTLKSEGKDLDSPEAVQLVLDWMKTNKPTLS